MDVRIPMDTIELEGELKLPRQDSPVVVFAHGSGSSRHSPRNQSVARALREAGLGTLLFDLLSKEEEIREARSGHLRFDIELLADRLFQATQWLSAQAFSENRSIGYFGASTGAAAAIVAAAKLGRTIGAVVSRGGRPDLASDSLSAITSPCLFIVGGDDGQVVQLNEMAYQRLRCEKDLRIIPGATHLFQEPGALEQVASLAGGWFRTHLSG